MKVVAMIGEPAVGKSTITREMMKVMSRGDLFKIGKVTGTIHLKEQVYVLGIYHEDQVFAGTDRLSMAVQPDAENFLEEVKRLNPNWTIFFEGDRLGNVSFLGKCLEIAESLTLVIVEAEKLTKSLRHEARHDSQTEKFLKGRATKIKNIRAEFPSHVTFRNDSLSDLQRNASQLFSFLSS